MVTHANTQIFCSGCSSGLRSRPYRCRLSALSALSLDRFVDKQMPFENALPQTKFRKIYYVHQRRYNRGQDNIPAEVLPFLKQRPGLSIQPAGRPDAAPPPPKPRVEIIPPLPPQLRQSTPPQPRLSTPPQPQPSQQQRNEAQRSSATRYHCEFCPYDTSSIQKLQSHLNSHQPIPSQHPMNIPNYCKPCNLQFASPGQLQAHLATHDAPRHTCMYCDKKFKTPATLKAHLKMHLGREAVPYERRCMFCEKTFRNEDHYQRHMMTVHSMGDQDHTPTLHMDVK